MEEEISLVELLGILKKHVGLIINFILFGVLLASIYTFFIATPQYSSTTDLIVNRGQTEQIGSVIDRSEIDTNLQLINTYSDIITRPVILDHVIEELEMDESSSSLADKITISNENNSQMFSITVTDENPYDAAVLANTTADVFQEQMPEILSVDNVAILSVAEANEIPVSPNNTFNILIGIVVGAIVGIGTAFLIDFLDNTVKDDRFIVEEIGWTSLGRVSEMSPDELASGGRLTPTDEADNTDSRLSRSRV
jgi:capsular polysaccharide biosynthesis protein